MPPDPTVFLVDDNEDVRESLAMYLGTCGLRTEAFCSAEHFLEAAREEARGCLVLDINMPGMDGLALQRELQARGVELPVIFLTGRAEIPLAVAAMKRGAVDYLQKPVNDAELLDSVYRALEVEQRQRAERAQCREFRAQLDALTPREAEVLDHLMEGEITKVIAATLDISPRTIELHRARIMRKMQCRTLAQLAYKVNVVRGAAG